MSRLKQEHDHEPHGSKYLPKTRTRTGCFTCRKRKKKCDECYPVCSGCSRNYLSCVWPDRPTDTLPKDFAISTSSTASSGWQAAAVGSANGGLQKIFSEANHFSSRFDDSNTADELDLNVPAKMCSVIALNSYMPDQNVFDEQTFSCDPENPDFILFKVDPQLASAKAVTTRAAVDEEEKEDTTLIQSLLPQCNAAMREVLLGMNAAAAAHGISAAARSHFAKASSILGRRKSTADRSWLQAAIDIQLAVAPYLSLDSPGNLASLIESSNGKGPRVLERTMLGNLLFHYTSALLFMPKNELCKLPSPFKLFSDYRSQFGEVIFDNGHWLRHVITGSAFNCFECMCKLVWILRHKDLGNEQESNEHLQQVKRDMTLIWTALQTSEIQLESSSQREARPILYFAKYVHQSLEILQLKAADSSIPATSPVVCFYLSQLLHWYKACAGEALPPCLGLVPLFIAGCTSQTLEDRTFISQELYLAAHGTGLPFIDAVARSLEDLWCHEEAGIAPAFDAAFDYELAI